ncbi:hypothetical protein J5N97_026467 [Dioscorea zingiberensis]|uniref:Early meiotic induction protein 1 n=1 Tax=Dioscorea zingiberensis TaxID=325984 RepID=A0A9D5H6H6_9LILI|nr:hypothetical protein J5N97_026467 [Dioscorea zingiberensis]
MTQSQCTCAGFQIRPSGCWQVFGGKKVGIQKSGQWPRMEDPKKEETPMKSSSPVKSISCIKCFDALWFCYSPFHQMQNYYRYGDFDNCFGKWNALFDCLSLKTKRSSEVQEILEAREKTKPHIWTYRTVEEASANWWRMYSHIVTAPPRRNQ